MEKYKTLFLWMIVPMVLIQLGIAMDYWGDFTQNTWAVHIHYWCATLWYGFLILQPWLATHGRMEQHRTYGMIGVFIAGGVAIGALSMLHRDLVFVQRSIENPERFGPFIPEFFYGIAVVEILMIGVFSLAVMMAIVQRRQLEHHACWLVSTVFVIMMPALGRGIQNLFILAQIDQWPDVNILTPILLTQTIILALLLGAAWKYGKLRHPATWLAAAANVPPMFVIKIGSQEWIQVMLQSTIKG